ncbi:MAG TPA: hypothetical protein VH025_07780 [Solirubrobacteraceae bacterium]|nr:hypothetical protein [Solirubrobacteraceae bacterium]
MSALGSVLLAVAVFLPWYGVAVTPSGVTLVEQLGDRFASQYGNATLQGYLGSFHAALGGIAGRQVATISGHDALHDISVVLLVIAGLTLLDALLGLARGDGGVAGGAGGSVGLLGAIAAVLVIYRMAVPPSPAGGLLSLSLRGGPWLAVVASLMVGAGALWPGRREPAGELDGTAVPGEERLQSAWRGLSGWTPGP